MSIVYMYYNTLYLRIKFRLGAYIYVVEKCSMFFIDSDKIYQTKAIMSMEPFFCKHCPLYEIFQKKNKFHWTTVMKFKKLLFMFQARNQNDI